MTRDIHLGVTGLRRSGKTVFLTALIYQLTQCSSRSLDALSSRDIELGPGEAKWPRDGEEFPYDAYLRGLRKAPPEWPQPTSRESYFEIVVPFDGSGRNGLPSGLQKALELVRPSKSTGTIHIHMHDYPGEYLLDVEMATLKYRAWCKRALSRMERQSSAAAAQYQEQIRVVLNEAAEAGTANRRLERLRAAYGTFLVRGRALGMAMLQPGMTLAGHQDLNGVDWKRRELPFVPLPSDAQSVPDVVRALEREYDDYVQAKVRPFVRRLAKADRQIVLVDVLEILRRGVDCFNDTQECLAAVIEGYRYARQPLVARLAGRRRIGHVIFAATKADHALESHRQNMEHLLKEVVQRARARIREQAGGKWPGQTFAYLSSLRSTSDECVDDNGCRREVLGGVKLGDTADDLWHPGYVPSEWPSPRSDGSDPWPMDDKRFQFRAFRPIPIPLRDGAQWNHLELDRVIYEMLRDCLPERKGGFNPSRS